MIAHFHPDGTADIEYCARCEFAMLERLQQFQCLSQAILISPTLHRDCRTIVKKQLTVKVSTAWERYMQALHGPIGYPLANVVKAATGIDL